MTNIFNYQLVIFPFTCLAPVLVTIACRMHPFQCSAQGHLVHEPAGHGGGSSRPLLPGAHGLHAYTQELSKEGLAQA